MKYILYLPFCSSCTSTCTLVDELTKAEVSVHCRGSGFQLCCSKEEFSVRASVGKVKEEFILCKLLDRNGVVTCATCGSLSFGKTVHKFTDHINASARNALQILWQCKCKYSYTSVVSILYIYVSLDLVLLHIIKQLVIFCLLYIN